MYEISKCISWANHLFLVIIVYSDLKCGDHGLASLCDWLSPGLAEQRSVDWTIKDNGLVILEKCFIKG